MPDEILPATAVAPTGERAASAPWLKSAIGISIALVAVVIAPDVLDTYTVNILIRALFVGIAAITVDVLWGYSGSLTFGQSAFFGLGSYGLAIVFTQFGFGPSSIALALCVTVVGAAVIAGFIGWLSFYPGSTPLYASVISLVLPIVVVQLLYSGGTFTGSSSGLVGFDSFDLSIEAWFRIAGVSVLVVLTLAGIGLRSDAGRLLKAMRDNDLRCAYLGLDTPRLRIILLVVCGVVAALAGFGSASFGGIAAPENASFTFGTQLVIMVALGGRGTLIGALVGALALELASAYLSGNLPFIWELIVGVAFVAVIVVTPSGLAGALQAGKARVSRAFRRDPDAPGSSICLAVLPQRAIAVDRSEVVIDVHDVSKHFGSLSVLSGVSFTARRGELVSLVGPNGAGKTTLIRCLADGRERSSGSVAIGGIPIGRMPPDRIVRLGLGRKFQAASIFETLTVTDCLRVARARRERPSLVRAASVLTLPSAALAVIEGSGLNDRLGDEARLLSHGLKQALELAMVLALEPEVILLDEPTAGLTRPERQRFAGILTDLVTREGLCVLIVEHDLDFVREISSRIIVLHQGRIALDGTVGEVVDSALVREIYTGHAAPEHGETTA